MTIQQLTISGLFLYVRAFNDKLSFPNRMHLVIIIHIWQRNTEIIYQDGTGDLVFTMVKTQTEKQGREKEWLSWFQPLQAVSPPYRLNGLHRRITWSTNGGNSSSQRQYPATCASETLNFITTFTGFHPVLPFDTSLTRPLLLSFFLIDLGSHSSDWADPHSANILPKVSLCLTATYQIIFF